VIVASFKTFIYLKRLTGHKYYSFYICTVLRSNLYVRRNFQPEALTNVMEN